MPNWTRNAITIYGDVEELKDLNHKLEYVFSKDFPYRENSWNEDWLGNVIDYFKLDEKIPHRGWLDEFDLDEEYKIPNLLIVTNSAWIPAIKMWDEVCKQYKTLKYVFTAEDEFMEFAINTDVMKLFDKTRYYICPENDFENGLCFDHYLESRKDFKECVKECKEKGVKYFAIRYQNKYNVEWEMR